MIEHENDYYAFCKYMANKYTSMPDEESQVIGNEYRNKIVNFSNYHRDVTGILTIFAKSINKRQKCLKPKKQAKLRHFRKNLKDILQWSPSFIEKLNENTLELIWSQVIYDGIKLAKGQGGRPDYKSTQPCPFTLNEMLDDNFLPMKNRIYGFIVEYYRFKIGYGHEYQTDDADNYIEDAYENVHNTGRSYTQDSTKLYTVEQAIKALKIKRFVKFGENNKEPRIYEDEYVEEIIYLENLLVKLKEREASHRALKKIKEANT